MATTWPPPPPPPPQFHHEPPPPEPPPPTIRTSAQPAFVTVSDCAAAAVFVNVQTVKGPSSNAVAASLDPSA